MADKRIIEQNASTTVPDDAYFIFDSALLGTFKISQSALLDFFGNATITEVTKAQYDALPDTKLTDGVLYAIKDQETSYVVDIEVDGSSILDEDGIADLSVISKIEEEIANAIAEEYDSTHTYYNTGLVFHEGVLYQCTATSVTGTWDSTKWNVVDIKDLLDNVSTNIGYLWNTINNTIAGIYDTSSTYNTGDYAIYSLKLYRCKDDDVTGAWNSSKWEEVNIPEYIDYVLVNAGKVDDVKVDGTSVVTNKVAEIEIPVKDVQIKTDSTYDSVVDDSGNAKIDLSSMTAYGSVPNLPQPIATFKDGADAPMKSLKVAIEPQQDLHGYDSPWVGGAGKNKLPLNVSNIKVNNRNGTWSGNAYTESGVTFTLLTDNSGNITGIKTNGTASANIYFVLSEGELNWITFDGSYVVNGCTDGSSTTYAIQVYSNESSSVRIDNFNQDNYIQSSSSTYTIKDVMIVIRKGYTASNLMFYPMIRLRSVTDATFEPYSNECPISGWSEANVTRCGKNLFGGAYNEYFPIHFNEDKIVIASADVPSEGTNPVQIAYYDKNKTLLDYWGLSTQYSAINNRVARSFTLPKESYYLRYITQSSANYQIEFGETNSAYEPYNGNTYTIDLDGTRYGGTLDVTTGVLTVDRVYYQFNSSKTYTITGSARLTDRWITSITNIPNVSDEIKSRSGVISSISPRDAEYISITVSGFCKNLSSPYPIFNINDSDSGLTASSSATDIVNAVNTFLHQHTPQIVYELATPITIQLTPTAVKSLLGQNNIWADTGDINECIYRRDMSSTIDDIIARLEALENA